MPNESITDPVGRRTYSPDEEVARKAPAVICAVVSRIRSLRSSLEHLRRRGPVANFTIADIEQLLRNAIAPLPFEKELFSGDIGQVDQALRSFPTETSEQP